MQWLSRPELEEMQLKNIRRLVSYAYEHVPYYGRRYRAEGIHPGDIKSLKDFEAIPFLTKSDIKKNLNDLVATDYKGDVFEDATGGSTGHPMRFFMDRSTTLWSNAVEARCRRWYRVNPGDKRAWVWGALKDFPTWHWRDRLGARVKQYRYLNSRTLTDAKMKEFAEMLLKWQPDMFRVYPTALEIFANYLKKRGIYGITPKLIETSAEKLTAPQKELFQEVFSAPVAEHYSSWEINDIAYQCPQGGIHIMEDRFLELVNAEQVITNGHMGEVVITSLNQHAMPFIRYKNDDLAIFEKAPCACGRGMPVLREIVGRNSDLLSRPDGSVVHWSSVYSIVRELKRKSDLSEYQVYQPDRNHIEMRLVLRGGIDPDLLAYVRRELRACLGETIQIAVKLVDQIDLTPSGKRRDVVSDVKPDLSA